MYLSAFVPAAGRCLNDEVPPPYRELFNGLAAAADNNTVTLPFEVFGGAFTGDAPEPVQKLVHDLLVPQPMQYFTETVQPIDPETLGSPVAYVLSTGDVALPPGGYGWARRFPERLGVTPIEAPGSHEALFTEPAGPAEALLKA